MQRPQWAKRLQKAIPETFDGNGHVIKNVSFRDSALHETAGIFGTVQSGGMVQKLGVENFTFERGNTQDRRAGGIAGQLMSGGTITDCYVINSTIKVTGRVVGGIAGLNKGNVENCFTAGLGLDGYSQRFGGITGDYAGGSIVNCYTDYAALGSTASSVGTAADSEAGISEGRFSSGEITYKLNGSRTDEDLVWYQTLTGDGKQDYPQFAGSVVYHDSINDSYGNHIHNWIYTKSDNTITATCNAAGCPAENGDGGFCNHRGSWQSDLYRQCHRSGCDKQPGNRSHLHCGIRCTGRLGADRRQAGECGQLHRLHHPGR